MPSMFAMRSQHTLALRDEFRDLRRQFDVSNQYAVDDIRDLARVLCPGWQGMGHGGSVDLVVVYPSAFSDGAFPPPARRSEGTGFRLIDLCVIE